MKKKSVSVLVGVLCLATFAGCGKSASGSENVPVMEGEAGGVIIDVDDALANTAPTSGDATTVTTENAVEEYAASEEIKNARFADHMIQIGDEIFQEGGYITFGELVAQLGDQYTMSDMTVDGLLAKDHGEVVHITKNDSEISLKAGIWNYTDGQISASDAVVNWVVPDGAFAETYTFIAGGMTLQEADMSYSDVVGMLKAEGYQSTATNYYAGSIKEANDYIGVRTVGKDKNLLGYYPVIGYKFSIDTSINKVSKVELSDGTTEGFIIAETAGIEFAGTPITSFSEITEEELSALFEETKAYLVENSQGYSTPYAMENITVLESYIITMKNEKVTIDGTEMNKSELFVIVEIDDVYDGPRYQAVTYNALVKSVVGSVEGRSFHGEFLQESLERVYKGTGTDYKEELILDSAQ